MPPASTGRSPMATCPVKENKPLWCSPGRPQSTVLRRGKGKPLGEIKSGNRGPSLEGNRSNAEKSVLAMGKKAPTHKSSPSSTMSCTANPKVPSQVAFESNVLSSGHRVVTSRPNSSKVAENTPRSKPLQKALTALVTPTYKYRKPTATTGTPRGGIVAEIPNGSTPTRSSRTKETNQAMEGTSGRNIRERALVEQVCAAQEVSKSGVRDKVQQGLSGTTPGSSVGRGRRVSPSHVRPPVKHLFLSPQVSKRAATKTDLLRKSIENHGRWAGSTAQRKRRTPVAEKRNVDPEMPPPAQPTNSPEIPRRGSRETSGEGIRGYFGAGPMVAPEGVGFVRDRRKCKPRGTLVVDQEGLSVDSDSSGLGQSAVEMPPPSVASVEWMMNNAAMMSMNDISSSSSLQTYPISVSSPTAVGNQASGSFGKERNSQENEVVRDRSLEKLSLGDDLYSKFTQRSQAFLQHLEERQSQLNRALSSSHVRPSQQSEDISLWYAEESCYGAHNLGIWRTESDLKDEDVIIDWRQGLPYDFLEMKDSAANSGGQDSSSGGRNEELRSSESFTSSWVRRPPEDTNGRRLLDKSGTWYAPESPWYGFSPITPEFHRTSQLPDGGTKAIDALLAGSVRRRIMTDDQSISSDKFDASCTSVSLSVTQVGNPRDSFSGVSSNSSQELCSSSSFQFATTISASGPAIVDMETMVQANSFTYSPSAPVERSCFSEDFQCQTASPTDQVYAAHGIACGLTGSMDCIVDCNNSLDGSGNDSENDEVEYASPILGDYLSPVKHVSRDVRRSDQISTDGTTLCDEVGMSFSKAVRRSSMSRTLEELMRHNITL